MIFLRGASNFLNLLDNLVNFSYFDAVDFIKTREDLNKIINGNVQLSPFTNIDQYNYYGYQPLHYAIQSKNYLAVEWLLSHENVPVNALTEIERWNSAHCAVLADDSNTLGRLIHAGADLNAVDSYLLTPLAYAKTDMDAEKWLDNLSDINPLNFNIRLGPKKRSYFHYFARDSMKLLLDYVIKMDIDKINSIDLTGSTPLMLAAETGQTQSLWTLLSNGALLDIIDLEGRSALHRAAAAGQSKACQFLLYDPDVIPEDEAVDKNDFTEIFDSSAVTEAAQSLLIVHDHEDLTPLMTAVVYGNIETVRVLAEQNSKHLDVKQRRNGDTALHLAVYSGSAEIVKILLEAGAYPDALNSSGKKPIDLCVKDSEIFDFLVEAVIIV